MPPPQKKKKNLSEICRADFAILFKRNARTLKSQERPSITMFVYKIQVNPIHTILKYDDYSDFMDR